MQLSLEQQDVENIVQLLLERLKPLLSSSRSKQAEESIMSVKGIAEYLGVDTSWVYKKVSFNEIPYFKLGKYTKFKKSQIDKWMDGQAVRPVPVLKQIANYR